MTSDTSPAEGLAAHQILTQQIDQQGQQFGSYRMFLDECMVMRLYSIGGTFYNPSVVSQLVSIQPILPFQL
ncbi:MAG: hypothetical protein ACI9P7_000832 [Candidatus Azotimanducaceae bacterium]|jgi:hypothetical protein